MNLLSLLTPELYALPDQDCLDVLNAKTITKEDHTPLGPIGLRKRLPIEVVNAAVASFEAAAQASPIMRMLLGTFQSFGFDFADQDTITSIDQLVAGGMPEEVGEALKSLGSSSISAVEQAFGIGQTATLEDVAAAKAAYAIRLIRQRVIAQYNAVNMAFELGDFQSAKTLWTEGLDLFE